MLAKNKIIKQKVAYINCISVFVLIFTKSTREQIRTATPLQAPAPQAGASTNFATRVWVQI